MQPMQALQDMLRMLSRVCCKRIGCAEAGLMCAMTFADAFFVANYTAAPTDRIGASSRIGGAEGARIELRRAVADLGASPDRFSSLGSESIVELKGVGKRLVTHYNDVVCALKCDCPISLDAALRYEISLAEFGATHAKLCRNNANSLQSKLDAHMLRINVSMVRTYKRARIIVAIKRGAVFFGRMPVAIVRQEEQVGKLVPYMAKKLSVLVHMAGSAARMPLINRIETVLAAVLSSTSTKATIDGARAIGILFQSPTIMATISKRCKNNNYGLRPLDIHEPIGVNGWDVVAVALLEGSTGAAACLLDEVIEVIMLPLHAVTSALIFWLCRR